MSFEKVFDLFLSFCTFTTPEEKKSKLDQMCKFWNFLVFEYDNQVRKDEYNSIKHGLRVRAGGFYFSIQPEELPGRADPSREATVLGSSEFGSRFPLVENIKAVKNKNYYQTCESFANWNPYYMIDAIRLICFSINNIILFLKTRLGSVESKEHMEYLWLDDETIFEQITGKFRSVGVASMKYKDYDIDGSKLPSISEEDILKLYKDLPSPNPESKENLYPPN